MDLTVGEKIRLIMRRQHVTVAELARRTKQTPQNLSNKFNRDNFSNFEMQRIADSLGCELEITFTDGTGERI